MELQEAIEFIRPAFPRRQPPQIWADLGSGNGLFTRALAALLTDGSMVYAIDRSPQLIGPNFHGNNIEFRQLDFSQAELPFADIHGLLMANSLHFIKEKRDLLFKLRKCLQKEGQLIIIEYELDKPNAWVPYPVSFSALQALLTETGFHNARTIGERRSIFGNRRMYACTATN